MSQYTIRTSQKKSCEQIEYFYNRKTKGKIVVRIGFRNAEFSLETNDDEFPDIEFTEPAKAMPDEYKVKSVVESYRNYYIGAKSGFAILCEAIKIEISSSPICFPADGENR